jgi:hypothetical protein
MLGLLILAVCGVLILTGVLGGIILLLRDEAQPSREDHLPF